MGMTPESVTVKGQFVNHVTFDRKFEVCKWTYHQLLPILADLQNGNGPELPPNKRKRR
jgi:hypothetical protein